MPFTSRSSSTLFRLRTASGYFSHMVSSDEVLTHKSHTITQFQSFLFFFLLNFWFSLSRVTPSKLLLKVNKKLYSFFKKKEKRLKYVKKSWVVFGNVIKLVRREKNVFLFQPRAVGPNHVGGTSGGIHQQAKALQVSGLHESSIPMLELDIKTAFPSMASASAFKPTAAASLIGKVIQPSANSHTDIYTCVCMREQVKKNRKKWGERMKVEHASSHLDR